MQSSSVQLSPVQSSSVQFSSVVSSSVQSVRHLAKNRFGLRPKTTTKTYMELLCPRTRALEFSTLRPDPTQPPARPAGAASPDRPRLPRDAAMRPDCVNPHINAAQCTSSRPRWLIGRRHSWGAAFLGGLKSFDLARKSPLRPPLDSARGNGPRRCPSYAPGPPRHGWRSCASSARQARAGKQMPL